METIWNNERNDLGDRESRTQSIPRVHSSICGQYLFWVFWIFWFIVQYNIPPTKYQGVFWAPPHLTIAPGRLSKQQNDPDGKEPAEVPPISEVPFNTFKHQEMRASAIMFRSDMSTYFTSVMILEYIFPNTHNVKLMLSVLLCTCIRPNLSCRNSEFGCSNQKDHVGDLMIFALSTSEERPSPTNQLKTVGASRDRWPAQCYWWQGWTAWLPVDVSPPTGMCKSSDLSSLWLK